MPTMSKDAVRREGGMAGSPDESERHVKARPGEARIYTE